MFHQIILTNFTHCSTYLSCQSECPVGPSRSLAATAASPSSAVPPAKDGMRVGVVEEGVGVGGVVVAEVAQGGPVVNVPVPAHFGVAPAGV